MSREAPQARTVGQVEPSLIPKLTLTMEKIGLRSERVMPPIPHQGTRATTVTCTHSLRWSQRNRFGQLGFICPEGGIRVDTRTNGTAREMDVEPQ